LKHSITLAEAPTISREQIIQAARVYLGTPYHHIGRVRGVGIDCIGLLTGVADDLDQPYIDLSHYSRSSNGQVILEELGKSLVRIEEKEATIGDVLVFWVGKPELPRHAAIITPLGIIHTHITSTHGVVEHGMSPAWSKRICAAFRYPGVRD